MSSPLETYIANAHIAIVEGKNGRALAELSSAQHAARELRERNEQLIADGVGLIRDALAMSRELRRAKKQPDALSAEERSELNLLRAFISNVRATLNVEDDIGPAMLAARVQMSADLLDRIRLALFIDERGDILEEIAGYKVALEDVRGELEACADLLGIDRRKVIDDAGGVKFALPSGTVLSALKDRLAAEVDEATIAELQSEIAALVDAGIEEQEQRAQAERRAERAERQLATIANHIETNATSEAIIEAIDALVAEMRDAAIRAREIEAPTERERELHEMLAASEEECQRLRGEAKRASEWAARRNASAKEHEFLHHKCAGELDRMKAERIEAARLLRSMARTPTIDKALAILDGEGGER